MPKWKVMYETKFDLRNWSNSSSSGNNNKNNGQQEEDEDDNEAEDDEYESEGLVSTMGDVYSYSIMLTETVRVVTRILLRPLQESFVEELSLKRWVFESFPDRVVNVVDANLFSRQDEQFSSKETCVKLLMELTLQCTSESPQDRISMKDVLVIRLNNIQTNLLHCPSTSQSGS
ncbi:hypothetical protein FXO38_00891 [Capsicum annuum]|uniref:Uncharacterized protein n=1 Tax=Capsicum annuum TaxID=4072 RepID=A0A2G3AFZ4_CAPAN|nr:hypothetical protein FXO38_00891 [Capsicum annuum]KAF3685451.1 hypothetical protein FXO37_00605 [Capsicum annuum]PHT93147.1 hypothetical protein T459_01029 [Capsicum annuum]